MAARISKYRVQLVRESAAVYQVEKQVRNPKDAATILRSMIDVDTLHVEQLGILALDTKNNVIGLHVLHQGGLNSCVVSVRSIFQAALLNNAASVILFHNHPSGDPEPSPEDIQFTKRAMDAGEIMRIEVLDHIVLGIDSHVSIKEFEMR